MKGYTRARWPRSANGTAIKIKAAVRSDKVAEPMTTLSAAGANVNGATSSDEAERIDLTVPTVSGNANTRTQQRNAIPAQSAA